MTNPPSPGTRQDASGSSAPGAAALPPADRGPAGGEGTPDLRTYAVVGFLAGAAVVAGAVVGGTTFASHLPGAWLFGTPGGPLGSVSSSAAEPPAVAVLAVYGGLVVLATVWWRMQRALRRSPGIPVRRIVPVVAAWAVPFLVAPPLFSRDVYSYAGQGAMVSFHINPYLYGPGVLGATPFNLLAGPLWANTPSPYGPTFLSLDGLVTTISDHRILADLLLLRLLAVVGVALVVVAVPTLARRAGHDPAASVVLAAGSPLVLATLVGGAHNDALMVGLLLAGLAAWDRYGPVPGIVLCSLAAGVKIPAAVAVVAIGWNWAPAGAGAARRVGRTLGALGIGAATLGAVSSASGVGWGWVTTVTAPDKVYTGVTPVDDVARGIGDALHLVGVMTPLSSVRTVASVVGVALAVAVGTWLLWRSPRRGPVRAVGLCLLVVSLLGPVLWAWYVTWGLVVLAPVAGQRLRRVVVWLSVAEALIGAASVIAILRTLAHAGVLDDGLVVFGVTAAGLLAARPSYELPAGAPCRSPWSGQRATHPAGVTVTAIQRPHAAQ